MKKSLSVDVKKDLTVKRKTSTKLELKMPAFKLEGIKYNPNALRTPQILYTKKEYSPKVKMENWYMELEQQPVDVNPYNPKCFRLHNSHYNRLGSLDHMRAAVSQTHHDLAEGSVRSQEYRDDPHKYLINGYSDKTIGIVCEGVNRQLCSRQCTAFTTTMQESYTPPFPLTLKGLKHPVTGSQYKRLSYRAGKFLDDNLTRHTEILKTVKKSQHISFNPCMGHFTDEGKTPSKK